jgi:hypothetical protein
MVAQCASQIPCHGLWGSLVAGNSFWNKRPRIAYAISQCRSVDPTSYAKKSDGVRGTAWASFAVRGKSAPETNEIEREPIGAKGQSVCAVAKVIFVLTIPAV